MAKDLSDELARLRREIDDIKARSSNTNQTTRAERKALRAHVEELDRIKKHPIKEVKPNPFSIGQIVELVNFLPERTKGKITRIACKLALPSSKQCNRDGCEHKNKNYIWVVWPSKSVIAYHFNKLRSMSEDELKPRIGRELSGKIGPWEYNVDIKRWKKNGDDKLYTDEEFSEIMYHETHMYAKEEGQAFIRGVKRCLDAYEKIEK